VPGFTVIGAEASGLSAVAYWVINPQAPVANSHIHGLGAEDLARAPIFAEIAATLAGQLEGLRVIAHNAGFDGRFLAAEYARLNMAFCTDLQFSWIDSLQIARQLVPTLHNLASLCTRFKIANPLPHAALGGVISAAGCAPSTPHARGQLLVTTAAYRAALCEELPPQREAYHRGLIAQLT
jgi:exonuclease, RNase T and DNA polymerase III